MIHFRSPALNLPEFALRPENLFDKIGDVFGGQDIDFESHPKFSKSYSLRGSDEQKVRETFTDEVLSSFENQTGISTEGGGDQLIFYRAGKRIDPDQVRSFKQGVFACSGCSNREDNRHAIRLVFDHAEQSPMTSAAAPVMNSHACCTCSRVVLV